MAKRPDEPNGAKDGVPATQETPLTCGIVMPISAIDGNTADHWNDVKSIIQDAVESIDAPKFSARLVSEADDVGIIQKRIVQGVYSSDIVVCDVSAKNANVMFELGLRLAFDKPTIIIKDDKTDYSFDTSIIEHLTYPRDLRFSKIVNFKQLLAEKIVATYSAAKNDPGHSTFLKSFGTFKIAHLDQKEAPSEQVILEILEDLQIQMSRLRRQSQSGGGFSLARYKEIVPAIIDLKKRYPNMSIEASDDMIEKLVDHHNNTTQGFSTREAFAKAVGQACEVATLLSGV